MSLTGSEPAAALPLEPLQWSFNPWRERPVASVFAAVMVLLMCAVVMGARESFVLTVALSLAAAATLSSSLTPLDCRVDDEGVARRGPLGWERRAWSDIRRAVLGRAGLRVSPYAVRNWLDPYRGLLLPLPAANRERLVPLLRPHLERHAL